MRTGLDQLHAGGAMPLPLFADQGGPLQTRLPLGAGSTPLERIPGLEALAQGAEDAGARVNTLPDPAKIIEANFTQAAPVAADTATARPGATSARNRGHRLGGRADRRDRERGQGGKRG